MPDTALWASTTAQAASRPTATYPHRAVGERARLVVDHMITPLGNRIQFVLDGKVGRPPASRRSSCWTLDASASGPSPWLFYAFTAPTLTTVTPSGRLKCSL